MKYQVVTETDLQKLVDGINEALEDGWEPIGGIQIAIRQPDNKWFFHQAIVLTEEAEKKQKTRDNRDAWAGRNRFSTDHELGLDR